MNLQIQKGYIHAASSSGESNGERPHIVAYSKSMDLQPCHTVVFSVSKRKQNSK